MTLTLGMWYSLYLRRFTFRQMLKATGLGWMAGLFCFIRFENGDYVLTGHLHVYPIASTVFTAVLVAHNYRERFARLLSEGDLFLLSISLFYMLTPWQHNDKVIAAIAAVPTVTLIWYAFSQMPLGQLSQNLLGVWALLLTSIFAVEQLKPAILQIARASTHFYSLDMLDLALLALETMLTINVFVLLLGALIPLVRLLPSRSERSDHYDQRLRENELPFVRSQILSGSIPKPVLAFILAVHGLPLLCNWYFNVVPLAMAMGYAMVLSPILTFGLAHRIFKPAPPAVDSAVVDEARAA